MTIFIYEHLTSGALADTVFSEGLLREGDLMLQAICRDLLVLGHTLCVMRDARLPAIEAQPELRQIRITTESDYAAAWLQCQRDYQQFIVIAPETGKVLEQLVRQLEQNNKTHLGATADAIAQCSDKQHCAQLLQRAGLPTPESWLAPDWASQAAGEDKKWVCKPIDGAGCEDTFLMDTQTLSGFITRQTEAHRQQLMVQPYIEGIALSINLFIDDEIELLSVNRQHLSQSGSQLHLDYCQPGCDDLLEKQQALKLARQIHATIPGLWGFIGVDLVLSDKALWIIDINPRLTLSYAEPAIRLNTNPALALHRKLRL
ncbi:ATP-grasp domain-containing protein [uncultured Methylophaga sp.]|uniref:ATP-grasp domain-containing protein n=1 Tax=uncultured Methylophaga sp. TaxID=285271 RepID=UPI0026299846|nr:ATP-grasp domain-containing protein [uncultured Methylophaga sp.]